MTDEERAEKIRLWLLSLPLRKTPMTEDERAGFERLQALAEEKARTGAHPITFEERMRQLLASETDPGRRKMYEDALTDCAQSKNR